MFTVHCQWWRRITSCQVALDWRYVQKNKIQSEAACIVTGATKLVSINSILTETRWETLSSRRILFYKMKNSSCLSYLTSLVPNNVGDISRKNLKNAQHSLKLTVLLQFVPSICYQRMDVKGLELNGIL